MQFWEKLGLLVAPDPQVRWRSRYAMLATPDLLPDGRLRLYYGTTDDSQIGSVAAIEVDPNPKRPAVRHLPKPILQPGVEGMFDDCGAVPSAVVRDKHRRYLYYSGFQRLKTIPYLLFTGLAFANGEEAEFHRHSPTPILDRISSQPTFRAGCFVLKVTPLWHMWYLAGDQWISLPNGKRVPTYAMFHGSSKDGVLWAVDTLPCLTPDWDKGETGFSRPFVLHDATGYQMWYSIRERIGTEAISYRRMGYAVSTDGLRWTRRDEEVRLSLSDSGWDSEMICYPALVRLDGTLFLFYSGNGNGREGLGWARLS